MYPNLKIRAYKTLKSDCWAQLNRHPSWAKSGMLQLARVSSVRFGNYSIHYQSILSWNLLQNYLSIDDISTLSCFVKFYLSPIFLKHAAHITSKRPECIAVTFSLITPIQSGISKLTFFEKKTSTLKRKHET